MTPDELSAVLYDWLIEYERRGAAEQALDIIVAELREERAVLRARIAELEANQPTEPQPEPTPAPIIRLKYAPPLLDNPQTVTITKPGTVKLDPNRDYILKLANVIPGYVPIVGGRNWVLIGGEFNIPHQGDKPSITSRTALKVVDCTGTAHIEGVLMHGADMSEGIQIDAPDAIVQIQNCHADGLDIRHDAGWNDPQHPDAIQPYGGCRELRVHRFTFHTHYQGLFLAATLPGSRLGDVALTDVNGVGEVGARYLLWLGAQGRTTLDNVWMQPHAARSGGFGKSIMPDIGSGKLVLDEMLGRQRAFWQGTSAPVAGFVFEGIPPEGDFVPAESVGTGYVSPGYA